MNEQQYEITQRSLGRRGILAAAGAVVAGIVAKQTAQPIAAAATMMIADTTSIVLNNVAGESKLLGTSGFAHGYFALSADVSALTSGDAGGLLGQGAGTGVGVMGLTSGATNPGVGQYAGVYGGASGGNDAVIGNAQGTGVGVYATSKGNHAVYGNIFGSSGSGYAGVYGSGNGNGTFGVLGDNAFTGSVGVQGQGAQYGVVGQVNNVANTIAVFGNNTSTGTGGIGVYGASAKGTGMYGVTNAANQYGVLGTTTAANSTAVAGIATTNGSSAFSGGTSNPNAYAGVFQGTVVIQGRLVVSDPSYKNGALQHPDGSTRLVYCVESPESWIEDFGKGHLVNGAANVPFDPDFTAVVHTDEYHVFLTPRDSDNKGLAVSGQRGDGFTVQELHAGTNSGAFSWRVVAKPKSTVKQERLAKFVMPTLKLPDANALPKPAPPKAAAPSKTP